MSLFVKKKWLLNWSSFLFPQIVWSAFALILPHHQIATAFSLTTSLLNAGLTVVPLIIAYIVMTYSQQPPKSPSFAPASSYDYSLATFLVAAISGLAFISGLWLLYLERNYCVVDFVGTRGVKDIIFDGYNNHHRKRGSSSSPRSSSSARFSRYFHQHHYSDDMNHLVVSSGAIYEPPLLLPRDLNVDDGDDLGWLVNADKITSNNNPSTSHSDLFSHWRESGQF